MISLLYLHRFRRKAKIIKPAEIAQLVEHDLAKVGVASSSLVFRSNALARGYFFTKLPARVVKLVDTQDLKSCNHCDCAGSSPAPGTKDPLHIARDF